MNAFSHVPPGFRFHPTDEELVDYYLRKKVASKRIDLDVIKDVDLYKIEPWDLQELCKIGSDEQNEWYFFSHKDKKYPTGTRTNRATKAGFWKATGRDKAIYSKHCLVGMRKTLVFYKGRAPNGQKSDWIMHEYRLETNENGTPQEEGWVVCRVFKKRMTTVRKMGDYDSPCWYDEQVSFMQQDLHQTPSPINNISRPNNYAPSSYPHHHYPSCKQELELLQYSNNMPGHDALFLQLPQLESPKMPPHQPGPTPLSNCIPFPYDNNNNDDDDDDDHNNNNNNIINNINNNINNNSNIALSLSQGLQFLIGSGGNNDDSNNQAVVDQVTTDWRVLDKFVASQLSHGDDLEASSNKETSYSNVAQQIAMLANGSKNMETTGHDYASTSTSSTCHIDLWK